MTEKKKWTYDEMFEEMKRLKKEKPRVNFEIYADKNEKDTWAAVKQVSTDWIGYHLLRCMHAIQMEKSKSSYVMSWAFALCYRSGVICSTFDEFV